MKPRFLACLIIFLTAASDRSSNGDGASGESFSGASAALSSFSLSLTCSVFALVAIHQAPETRSCRMRPPHLQRIRSYSKRDAGCSNRHPAYHFVWSVILSENRYL